MSWTFLLAAGALEIAATTVYRVSDNFSKLWPSAAFVVLGLLSCICLQRALHHGLSVGTAYAVWTGIGAAGTVLIGVTYFNEPADVIRLGLLAILVACIAGLKLTAIT